MKMKLFAQLVEDAGTHKNTHEASFNKLAGLVL